MTRYELHTKFEISDFIYIKLCEFEGKQYKLLYIISNNIEVCEEPEPQTKKIHDRRGE